MLSAVAPARNYANRKRTELVARRRHARSPARHPKENAVSIIDHVGLSVSDYANAKRWYERALLPLGIKQLMEHGEACGFGREKPDFWISKGPGAFQRAEQLESITPVHLAFRARSREEVDAFYRAALEAGGKDFGPPGIRAIYHPNYYGAFVLDLDGHNVEAVFHGG
jgi:catechol 2,3-dioxygenase-like lactoylglutathione lyase family enzyme